MAYSNNGNNGIKQLMKGSSISNRNNQIESFEIRICLDENILKVATLPDYESIL